MITRRALVSAAAALSVARPALAQGYPDKPIRLIVPSASGGPTDDAAELPVGGSAHRDAVSALIALGFKAADADQAVRRAALAINGKITTEALIKKALS